MSELKVIVKYVGPESNFEVQEVLKLPKEFKTFENISQIRY
jgi:hypothetical protein